MDGVVEKNGMHRLAHRVIAAEGKGDVADAAGDARAGEVGLDPAGGLDEIDGIVVVLLKAGRDGENVRIEDDVFGGETDLVHEDVIGAGADFDAAGERIGLALFVEGHDDGGGAISQDELGPLAESGLAFLEAE